MPIPLWVGASLLVGFLGRGRALGFWGVFLSSLVVSPLLGFVVLVATRPRRPRKA